MIGLKPTYGNEVMEEVHSKTLAGGAAVDSEIRIRCCLKRNKKWISLSYVYIMSKFKLINIDDNM